jgi:hypothetical protein
MSGPQPKGRPWLSADDEQLFALINAKTDRPSIARKLKRTDGAIRTRLKVLRGKTK